MGVRLRDDVIESVRLVARTDWWVGVDLLAGIAGFVVWVAGTGALGLQVATLADYPVAPDGTPTMPVLGLAALLWLLFPAALGVARVRSRLLNIRNNVEQHYRLDRPAALLVPPGLLVAILLGIAVAMGTVDPLLFVALAPAALYLLVRTTAYSYRVYAFSHPLFLYAALFATLVVQAAVLLLYLGLTTENEAIVLASTDALGLPVDPLAVSEIAGITVPTGLAATVGLPVGLVVAYLLVQSVAALIVRMRDPTVRPGQVRTGQRYPPWLDVASNGGRSASSASSGRSANASTASTGSSTSNDDGQSGALAGDTGESGSPVRSDSGVSAEQSQAGADDSADPDVDSVSHTRVFTPPGDGGDDPLSPVDADEGDPCPGCGATVPADDDQCPACGADAA